MKITFITLALFSFGTIAAQESKFNRECSISSGYGYANRLENSIGGPDFFIQMSYQLNKQFSIATEFENMFYKLPGYYPDFVFLPTETNKQYIFDNYYSLLIKYHLPFSSMLHASVASGWTFYTRQNEYYLYFQDSTSETVYPITTSFSNFSIPFLLETQYPLWKNLSVGIRVKYNLNPLQGNTYSASVAASLHL